ncbi:alpha-L-glutamate ligase homolog [Phocoenobacter uteri]|uniref:Alpha-L-glutamate ligase homolog n=1 Tax=Phocoenobacter uteri TaxID=146806 RepID=A0A379CBU7_9PAST|nr:sugar-transfer associated ATP-grasp domain-containing protein [Phocoenobacter uteri]MDG6881125.1 hypothetical protein [Phocoenobacter uteri]SUB59147.1 alpha-L-glutamate ligase homolog [Phocoenobacter uteri]
MLTFLKLFKYYWKHLLNYKYVFRKRKILSSKIWGDQIFSDAINTSFNDYLSHSEKSNSRLKSLLIYDIIDCYSMYGITPKEYFVLNFRNKGKEERASFLSIKNKDEMCLVKPNAWNVFQQLENKSFFYSITKKYFSRELISINSIDDQCIFSEFYKKHNSFIIKSNFSHSGKGIKLIRDASNENVTCSGLFNKLFSDNNKNGFIVEELIEQAKWMKEWNSSSVNTIRIPSIRNSKGYHILNPFLRFGQPNCDIDNAGAGGAVILIDKDSGTLISNAHRQAGDVIKVKPETGELIKGLIVPKWKELLILTQEIHKNLPEDYYYVGFDFALTEDKWVLIEGNWGAFLSWQQIMDKGCKEEFQTLMEI